MIQIPRDADFPFQSITIESNRGGSLNSALNFSPEQLLVDFCGDESYSNVALSDFAVSDVVSICASFVNARCL